MSRLHSILVKPAGSFCNIECTYCFYLDKHRLYDGAASRHRMSDTVLEKLIGDMFDCSDAPTFIWQGGEPTVLGLAFFERVVALQRRHCRRGQTYSNALQTHGLLLTPEWAQFLKREGFLVGLSLDGPEAIHDRYRRDRQGNGTFQKAFDNGRMLLEQGVPVNVLATVTDHSVPQAAAIYRFFTQNGFDFMQFSPAVETDPHDPGKAAPYTVDAEAYGRFLHRLFEAWLADFGWEQLKQKSSIRFFDSLLQLYVGMAPDHCALQTHCNVYLVAEHNGDLFSCDFLVGRDTWVGNLMDTSLRQAFASPAHQAFGARKAAWGEKCRHCRWLRLCYGGCTKDRLRDPADRGHNHFCRSYEYFFEKAHPHLERLALLYRQNYQ